jgi:type 2 lantibiotic biosynthesis protein LanM
MTMTVTKPDLEQIVAFASSLFEHLSNGSFSADADRMSEQQAVDRRMTHWCQVVAQGNWEIFHKRLAWDGLDVDRVRSVLGTVRLNEDSPLPNWAETLNEVIQTAREFNWHLDTIDSDTQSIEVEEAENLLPFEDLLLPAILVARQKLFNNLGCCASLSLDPFPLELLSIDAYVTLENSLLMQLVSLCVKTLESEFSRFRPLGYKLFNLLAEEQTATKNKEHYNAFVVNLLQDGLLAFFQKYPVLGRLVATAIDLWVEATSEFLQRLKADQAEIEQLFLAKPLSKETDRDGISSPLFSACSDSQLGRVIAIKSNLSDPHNRGRSVILIEFESELKLVYKPKNLGLEVAYNQFLDWCNQHGVPLPFKVLKVCDRQTYGWVEYVKHQPLEDDLAAQRFYQRSGALLCILYLLQGTDCHHENLIACGEHLVLVDMETLMHHEASEFTGSSEATAALDSAHQKLFDSVLRSGLLPRWEFTQDNRMVYDVSGLGSVGSEESTAIVQRWKFVNTDDMHLGYEKIATPGKANEAILNGVILSPNNHIDVLVQGFEQMYHFLIEQRQALLSADGPLTKMKAQQVRFVFRNTSLYGIVLQNSLAPQFLQNGVDRSIELDILSRAFLLSSDKPKEWSVLRSELRAMEQLDIPYFGSKSHGDDVTDGLEQPIKGYFKEPSYSQVLRRLQALDETDLGQQVTIIQSAFHAKIASSPSTNQVKAANTCLATGADFSGIRILTAEQLFDSAQAIAQSIQGQAIRGADSSVHWIGLGYMPNPERFQFQILDDGLYGGNCGIALFLAALDHVSGDNKFRDLALGAMQSLRKFLQTADVNNAQRFARAIGIGGATGLGSIVYCLVKISQFLKEPALLDDAGLAANLISSEVMAADRKFDIIEGAAGAILGLLALYSATGERAILEKSILCGNHLLAHRISVDDSPRAWKNLEKKPLTGFSHGAAGIAYALLRLYSATQDCAYQEAAVEGIAYERSVFNTSTANWPDFRSIAGQPNEPGFMVTWCHGAAGIGLARSGSLEILDTEEIRQDLEVALQTTQKHGLHGVDHLCCGNFGRIEVLLAAAKTLGREELFKVALHQASELVAKAEETGGYELFGNLPNSVFSPSFFLGTAGIGYELLRLAYPEKLPSVLLMA